MAAQMVKRILVIEPNNRQAKELHAVIQGKMKEGMLALDLATLCLVLCKVRLVVVVVMLMFL